MSSPTYETADETARRLCVSLTTLYRWVRTRQIPFLRVGQRGKLLFDPAAVAAALQRTAMTATTTNAR